MSSTVQLGPFELTDQIDAGGMGAVYRAEHVDTGEPVAVKALLAERARKPRRREEFRREVQALAKLDHPSIAAVLDYGEMDAAAAASGPESFAEGAPWFAMEYVDGGPLPHGTGEWTWEPLKSAVLALLDALSHAHARSIVHRDLKPGNILTEDGADGDGLSVSLVDFGIARHFTPETSESGGASETVTGTPKYMAPEQIRGSWRDQGPWTDLYSLGCVIWRIVCGIAPFEEDTTKEVLAGHLRKEPPAFDPAFPVPEGLETWLQRLLRKPVDERTRRAADAAWQLIHLGEAVDRNRKQSDRAMETGADGATLRPRRDRKLGGPTLGTLEPTDTDDLPPTLIDPSPADSEAEREYEPEGRSSTDAEDAGLPEEPPPTPSEWRRHDEGGTAAVLPRAGLELFALREVPLVDREGVRDQLWRELEAVRRDGAPSLVLLEGPSGRGKTRLAQWLARRADEVGAARVLEARHDESSPPDAGLRSMVERTFRTAGLSRGEVYERLLDQLPALKAGDNMRAADARALTELLRPTDDEADEVDGPRYRFSEPEQKYALIERFLERMTTDRPLVLWVDDLQWGRETIGALEAILERSDTAPALLVVATLRSDVVAEDPLLEDQLERLYETTRPTRVALDTLEADDQRELIDRLLALEPSLAEELADRTEGNPLFAIQLLRDWVDRSALVPGDDGFELAEDADLEVPEDTHALWLERLARLVEDLPGVEDYHAWRALERAATLGREVASQAWLAVAREVGLEAPRAVRSLLVKRGLGERTDEGWAFAHGMLAESLRERAHDAGRLETHHRRCAELLDELYANATADRLIRRATHLEGAGELQDAIRLLGEAASVVRERTGNSGREKELLVRVRELMDAHRVPQTDRRRAENELQMVQVEKLTGEPDSARRRAERVREQSKRQGWPQIRARAERELGALMIDRGRDFDRAEEHLERAERIFRREDAEEDLARCSLSRGLLFYRQGEVDEARPHLEEARRLFEALNEQGRAMRAQLWLAWCLLGAGDPEGASREAEAILEAAREGGRLHVWTRAANLIGDAARLRDDSDRAVEAYREALQVSRAAGIDTIFFQLNLAQALVGARRLEEARSQLPELESTIGQPGREWLVPFFRLCVAACAADQRRWGRWEGVLDELRSALEESDTRDRDLPWLAEQCAAICLDRAAPDRAREAYRLARELWRDLDAEEEATRVQQLIDQRPDPA